MGYAEDLRERKEYATKILGSEQYKKISIWEKDAQDDDFTKVEKHSPGGKIEIVDISESVDERLLMKCQRNYRWFFEKLKTDLESEPTVFDYHYLYTELLKDLTSFLTEDIYFSINDGNADRPLEDILYAHEKEELKLELVFIEYAEKLKIPESNAINKIDTPFSEAKKKTEFDEELIREGMIDEDLNAINSAPDIAVFLVEEMLMEKLKPIIIMRYKYNGKPFTYHTARKAVTFAKTNAKLKK